ncbi:hypothetical protein [Algoriphagus limi]|uniref:Immunity protein 42 n=1 Tax=Algoriphagus limi TaxID=2975273 RepID=A0ABT2G0W6_9BACT|nr:hypothetical protein [Algoriphagus limi]MCS5488906.1 hypothetical protein [Algoriphagus limi]
MITYRDTNIPIECPFCETDTNCEHLFAQYDSTYGIIECGYIYDRHDFDHTLERFFISKIHKFDYPKNLLRFKNQILRDFWDEIVANEYCIFNQDSNKWEFSDFPDTRYLLFDLLDDIIYPENGEFEAGPGSSCSYKIYYSEDPEEDYASLIKSLKALLDD